MGSLVLEPKTIYQIYEQLLEWRVGITSFRVRDIDTNSDFLIYKSEQWAWDNSHMPKKVIGLLLADGFRCDYALPCDEKVWTLLSSKKEVDYLRVIGSSTIPDLIKINYV